MLIGKRLLNVFFLLLLANFLLVFGENPLRLPLWSIWTIFVFLVVWFIAFNIVPRRDKQPNKRLRAMIGGYELFATVGIASLAQLIIGIMVFRNLTWDRFSVVLSLLLALPILFLVAANAFFRVLFTSQQLRVLWRVLLVLFWWFPLLNLYIFRQVCHIVRREYQNETARMELNDLRAENEVCKTKYPLVLVHGIFFRDWQLINYWGRIPRELTRNGADVYYGGQQSAAAVSQSAEELKANILGILDRTGAEKVNIIAHSKGGLDSRYAISRLGISDKVASLTTINTPHRGCIFAQTLLKKLPKSLVRWITRHYNSIFHKLGDPDPDFLAGIIDLTASKCAQFNKDTPDAPGVYYQSVMSLMKKASSAGPPLNFSYLLVQKYDKEPNDGLVSLSSAHWGKYLGDIAVSSKRGISHGDVIDLMREDIPGFDVREFYVGLVKGLKEKGF